MAISNGLLVAKVAHARTRPVRNQFTYSVYYICVALRDLTLLNRLWLFSLNRWNLLSLLEKNYGIGELLPQPWIRSVLEQYHITQANGEVVLLTMPRIMGYAFNPVSFWFCLDASGQLRAVLAEVSNTFGEKHCYLLFHDDQRPITPDDWLRADKVFHVSPFLAVNGHYEFRFSYSETAIGVWINHHDATGELLTTSLAGKRSAISWHRLLWCFFRYPFVTIKVIALIHYQAIKLLRMGIRYLRKPLPPASEISR
jgi:DUF1365 family protein